ncbi:peptidase M23 [Pedobacter yulinensis]|uniref:Peptidase M23 n=1 Tax=Pedobacter yulinensis TaxID=2126353 RepID=A0A2T3HRW9_9SPHI|nr:peptidoglycan DD-metalloendopeptidase family protein [Pedobacter yulinensis]PST85204.1 peptidase M23 [Pedobacter yulinensis]
MTSHPLAGALDQYRESFSQVVPFDPGRDSLYRLDLTLQNSLLNEQIYTDTTLFSRWINEMLRAHGARYGIGGYAEHRDIYAKSDHFDASGEPRRLHLGVDIWGPAGTPVFNFYDAVVHSFADNNRNGDYGATIILKYELGGHAFHALYGHLNRAALAGLQKGGFVPAGKQIASLGVPQENGNWPPHLHFQLIIDMKGMAGDFPGVCRYSERDIFLANCPDPQVILSAGF